MKINIYLIGMCDKNWKDIKNEELRLEMKERQLIYTDHMISMYQKLIGFNNQIVSFLGLIGGFGFTVYASERSVETLVFFVLGEFFILFTAIQILFWTRNYYEAETINLSTGSIEWGEFYKQLIKFLHNSVTIEQFNFFRAELHNQKSIGEKLAERQNNLSSTITKSLPEKYIWQALIGITIMFSSFFIDISWIISLVDIEKMF